MNPRTAAVFADAHAQSRAALIGYLPAGFPTLDASIALIDEMLAGGVDLVEVGLPYSDPLMDGAAIQEAVNIALANGTTTDDVLSVVERIDLSDRQAAVVMSYWNPIERFGVQRFVDRMAAAGGSGVITPDLTPEEAQAWIEASDSAGIDRTFLVAPSSTDARIGTVARACTGFVYAASTMGVTGARDHVSDAAPALVRRVRSHTPAPIGVGLGVSSGDQAAGIAGYADGVIVGSAFVRRILDAGDLPTARAMVRGFAEELAEGVRRPVDRVPVTAN
jgi:tryptophan synthase alpha chain